MVPRKLRREDKIPTKNFADLVRANVRNANLSDEGFRMMIDGIIDIVGDDDDKD